MIDFFGSERHFCDHLAPIWHALRPRERGRFFVLGRAREHALALGIEPAALVHGRPPPGPLVVVVASYQDLRMAKGRRAVLVNHGAGQRYDGDPASSGHPSYSGGTNREAVALFLCPSEADAEACRPTAPAAAVGCPKLDRFHAIANRRRGERTAGPAPRKASPGAPPTVAFGWHSDLSLCPETRSAFRHFAPGLRELASDPSLTLLGHGHPRAWPKLERFYRSVGIEPVRDFAEVLARADLYACDNSSTIFEAASCGLPVLVLNAPWYRRDVEHGLRFWAAADVGIQVDEPGDLRDGLKLALEDPPWQREIRERIVSSTYSRCDGRAAERAAAAIREVTG